MRKLEIEPGHRFGDWIVVAELPQQIGHRYFSVRCTECGDEHEEEMSNLKARKVKCFKCKPAKLDTYLTLSLQPIGLLVPLGVTGEGRGESASWMCVCARCKVLCVKDTKTLRRHQQQQQRGERSFLNCGCYRAPRRFDHGMSQTPEYKAWQSMKNRCENPKAAGYERYGGRGITVCERWKNFKNYIADMGERPEGHSLERRDNDGPYSPENCYWAPIATQNRNKSNNRWVSHGGENHVVTDFAAILEMPARDVSRRLAEGWSPEEIAAYAPYYNNAHTGIEDRAGFEALI